MTIILGLFVLYIILNITYVKNGLNDKYISKENSKKINGIFVLLVFFSHISQQITLSSEWIDNYFSIIISKIGQLMVTTFIFYSGYGIYESIKSKNEQYINLMPKNRILKTIIKFDIAVLIYVLLNYIIEKEYSLKTILLSFLGWSSVGNSNWYIFSIIWMYIFTYISFKLLKKDNQMALILNTVLVIIFMIIMSMFKEPWWYNTLLCYPFGMWFSKYKDIIEKYLERNNNLYKVSIITILIFTVIFMLKKYMIIYSTVYVLSFISIVILFTMKFKFKDKTRLLDFLGNNVFYIYIYQRIPMILFKNVNIIYNNIYVYFSVCLIVTLIIAISMNFICNKINNLDYVKNKKK